MFPTINNVLIGACVLTLFVSGGIIERFGMARVRRYIIDCTEMYTVFMLVGSTAAGAVIGFPLGATLIQAIFHTGAVNPQTEHIKALLFGAVGSVVVGFIFFAVAAIPLSLIFLLSQIEANTRRAP
jgi:hypothetical protein